MSTSCLRNHQPKRDNTNEGVLFLNNNIEREALTVYENGQPAFSP